MSYRTGSHTIFHHRYHIVWGPKYRYKVLAGEIRERVRDIVRQVCQEMGVEIISGVLSRDHVHMCLVPESSGVCYTELMEAKLWDIYTTLTPAVLWLWGASATRNTRV